MNDLDTLIPPVIELQVGGETLRLLPLKVGQLPAFLRTITPVLPQLSGPSINWLGLLGAHGDDLLSAMAIAVNKPRAWVDDLAADEAILLAAKVIEVNADFFTRTVIPKLDGLFTAVKPVTGSGGIPLPDSTNGMTVNTAGSTPSST